MSAGVFFGEMFGGFVQCSGVIFYEINFKGGGVNFYRKMSGGIVWGACANPHAGSHVSACRVYDLHDHTQTAVDQLYTIS